MLQTSKLYNAVQLIFKKNYVFLILSMLSQVLKVIHFLAQVPPRTPFN